jgi:hypothetical protein
MKISFARAAIASLTFVSLSANAEVFGKMYKVLCPSAPEGCACRNSASDTSPAVTKFTMYQEVPGATENDEIKNSEHAYIELKTKAGNCFMHRDSLRAVYWPSDICPNTAEFKKLPFLPVKDILKSGSTSNTKIATGKLFPTFYNVAQESMHPGAKTETLYKTGSSTVIAKVSKNFRDALDLEGTGMLTDGRILNVGDQSAGYWKYVILPTGAFGLGIHGHYLYPYRTAAVDFPYLCQKLGRTDCGEVAAIRKKLVGTLLFFPKLVGMPLPNGAKHDGYICAHDIGGAIKNDRVDLFVGPMGGGSPFYAPCQRPNAYSDFGIHTLVPSDWKSWKPAATPGKFERVNQTEYRTSVPKKALEFSVVKDTFCKPLF